MNSLAAVLHGQGELDAARQLFEQTLEGRRRTLGPEHPRTLTSMNNLAMVLEEQGAHQQAQQIRQEVRGAQRRRWALDATPFIDLVIAAIHDHSDARAKLSSILTNLRANPHGADLADSMQRIVDGERDRSLVEGLDEQAEAIASEVLRRLTPSGRHRTDSL